MIKRLKEIRKSKISKDELIADFIFFAVSFLISLLMLFVFDIHWNFYPGGQIFPPEKHVFESKSVYLIGGLIGSIIGFFIIKLFLFGVKEEEKVWRVNKNKKKR